MIFVKAQTEPTVFLMLAEKDLQTMREGRTIFVGPQQTGDEPFTKVILSLHKTNEAALEILRLAGHDISKLAPEACPNRGKAAATNATAASPRRCCLRASVPSAGRRWRKNCRRSAVDLAGRGGRA